MTASAASDHRRRAASGRPSLPDLPFVPDDPRDRRAMLSAACAIASIGRKWAASSAVQRWAAEDPDGLASVVATHGGPAFDACIEDIAASKAASMRRFRHPFAMAIASRVGPTAWPVPRFLRLASCAPVEDRPVLAAAAIRMVAAMDPSRPQDVLDAANHVCHVAWIAESHDGAAMWTAATSAVLAMGIGPGYRGHTLWSSGIEAWHRHRIGHVGTATPPPPGADTPHGAAAIAHREAVERAAAMDPCAHAGLASWWGGVASGGSSVGPRPFVGASPGFTEAHFGAMTDAIIADPTGPGLEAVVMFGRGPNWCSSIGGGGHAPALDFLRSGTCPRHPAAVMALSIAGTDRWRLQARFDLPTTVLDDLVDGLVADPGGDAFRDAMRGEVDQILAAVIHRSFGGDTDARTAARLLASAPEPPGPHAAWRAAVRVGLVDGGSAASIWNRHGAAFAGLAGSLQDDDWRAWWRAVVDGAAPIGTFAPAWSRMKTTFMPDAVDPGLLRPLLSAWDWSSRVKVSGGIHGKHLARPIQLVSRAVGARARAAGRSTWGLPDGLAHATDESMADLVLAKRRGPAILAWLRDAGLGQDDVAGWCVGHPRVLEILARLGAADAS